MDITKLAAHLPANMYAQLPEVVSKFQINTSFRMAHFLGECAHESAHFTRFEENLNYSASALLSVFPKYFDNKTAQQYARHPQMIANRVYANRMGNGNEASGDGWRHRGFGAIQTTGKANQQAFFLFMGLPADSDPSLLATQYPLISGAYFFYKNGLLPLCDHGVDTGTITTVRRRVNGGTIGLQDCIALTTQYYNYLN